ncbi:MAG: hypothetical protein CMH04_00785 [Marinovum sp.]|nr:hypothetical protein [Marinovum sp.]
MTGILKVDQIQNNTGAEAINIDANGRPLIPNGKVPCFHVSRVNPQTIAQATAATVFFDTTDFMHGWTMSSAILTCGSGSGGIYSINFRVRINSGTDGNWHARIQKNGGNILGEYMQNEYYEYANVATLASIADGDTINAVVYQNIGSITNTIGGIDLGPNCYMYAHRISG